MKKNYKNIYEKNYKIIDPRILLSNFNFAMIYIICKILLLLKNHHNDLKDNVFECFFKKYNRILFFLIIFLQNI